MLEEIKAPTPEVTGGGRGRCARRANSHSSRPLSSLLTKRPLGEDCKGGAGEGSAAQRGGSSGRSGWLQGRGKIQAEGERLGGDRVREEGAGRDGAGSLDLGFQSPTGKGHSPGSQESTTGVFKQGGEPTRLTEEVTPKHVLVAGTAAVA